MDFMNRFNPFPFGGGGPDEDDDEEERAHIMEQMEHMNRMRGMGRMHPNDVEYERHRRDMMRRLERERGRGRNQENIMHQENEYENEPIDENIYLEDLIYFPKKIYPKSEEEDLNILSLSKFKEMNINKLKEEIFYYCSPPEILAKLRQNADEDKNYEFYQDLNSEIFLFSQKEKNKLLSNKNIKLKSLNKSPKLSNYNDYLCLKMSESPEGEDPQEKKRQIENANLIISKIEDITLIYKDEKEKIFEELRELEKIIRENKIEMKSLGIVFFSSIENNLCILMNILIDEFEKEENNDKLRDLGIIFKGINENFKSVKLMFLFIKFCSSHQTILDSIKSEVNQEGNFLAENSLDFQKICKENSLKSKIFIDFSQFIREKEVLDKIKNEDINDIFDYSTLIYNNNIFLFLNYPNNKIKKFENIEDNKDEEDMDEDNKEVKIKELNNKKENNIERNKGNTLYYLKISLFEKRVIDFSKIELIGNANPNSNKIIDINISIKNEFIYLFYIVEKEENKAKKYYLEFKIYNQNTMGLIKEHTEDFKDFTPIKIFNDNKFIYCMSEENGLYVVRKTFSHNNSQYSKYSIQEDKIINLKNLKMHNYLSINNLFFLENENQKYIAKFTNNKDEYKFYITPLNNSQQNNNQNIKLTYNNNRFLISNLVKNGIIYKLSDKDNNNLIENGIFLLPFNCNNYNNSSQTKNIYEYLLQQYSSFLNIYGNFDLLNKEIEKNLIFYPFSYCCNFKEFYLNFVIKKIMEYNEENDLSFKLYYLIILKQMVCSLFNAGIFKEDKLKELLIDLHKFLLDNINEERNIKLDKIIREIIEIITYINENSILELKDISNQKINIKTKFLLIELLLEQKNTQKDDALYEFLIDFEKNYLIDIFNIINNDVKENIKIPNYSLYKKIMRKATEILFSIYSKDKDKLNKLIPSLSNNILEIFTLYKNIHKKENIKTPLYNYSLIYNSFNFRLYYLIIQNIIANKFFINKEIISSFQKILLFLDENNINDNYYKYLDMNNIIEVKSSSLSGINEDIEIPIELNEPKNLIIKTSLSSNKKLNDLIQIVFTKKNNERFKINLNTDIDSIFYEIKKIGVTFMNRNQEMKNNFIVNFISVINVGKYSEYLKNEDNKIISLIQKSIIYCLLHSLDNIENIINDYNEDSLIKNHSKIYQNELFKNINIKNLHIVIPQEKEDDAIQIIEKNNKLINNLNKIIGFDINEKSLELFEEEEKEAINSLDIYKSTPLEDKDKKEDINTTNTLENIEIQIFDEKYQELMNCFKFDLIQKKLKGNEKKFKEKFNVLIFKILEIAVKFYNYYDNFEKLIKDIKLKKIEEINKDNINEISSIENYKLFYSLYELSYLKLKNMYEIDRNGFNGDNIEEEENKYIQQNLEKLKFIYDIIISKKEKINMNISIIEDILNTLKNIKNIETQEMIGYSKIQDLNCQLMKNELQLINILLDSLKKEENLMFLLNLVNKKIRQSHNKGKPFFDNLYGVDDLIMNNIKIQFINILKKICQKIGNEKNDISISTKISLFESLIWKIKEEDFGIFFEIVNTIKNTKIIKKINNLPVFSLENKNIFNIKYYNEEYLYDRKIEIFEILISQIFKDNIINENREEFDKLIKIILDITPENNYYHDFILFFYINIINLSNLVNIILSPNHNIFKKVMEISLIDNQNKINRKDMLTKLIVIKILYQVIKNIKKEQIQNLYNCCKLYDEKIPNDKNPIIYLYELIFDKLKKNYNNDKLINKYYSKILIMCLNKLIELENKDIIKELINDKISTIVLLSHTNYIDLCENNFITKTIYNQEFEDIALFSSEDEHSIKSGKIICFLSQENDKSINNYLSNNSIIHFDKNKFEFYTQKGDIDENKDNNDNDVFVIMDDTLQSSLFKITSTEIKSFSDIIIKNENNLQKSFIKNNSKLIYDVINKEFLSLNDKGIYFALKILIDLINYLDKEEILKVLKNIWNYYDINKSKKKEEISFCSLEFMEDKINKILSDSFSNNSNIYKEIYENKNSISHLFNYFIENRNLGLSLKSRNKVKWFKEALNIPINNLNPEIKEIYKDNYQFGNISFYKSNQMLEIKELNDDSILFMETINDKNDLEIIEKILNEKKINAIIIVNANIELDLFVKEKKIPIYTIYESFFIKFYKFFIIGIGGNYIDIVKNISKIENSNIVDIYKINLSIDNEDNFEEIHRDPFDMAEMHHPIDMEIEEEDSKSILKEFEKKRNKKYKELIDDVQNYFCLVNIELIKRLVYDIICLDSINISEFKEFLKWEDILYILEVLILEYYFNIKYNLSNDQFKQKIRIYLKKFSNEWKKVYFDEYMRSIKNNTNNPSSYNDILNLFDIEKRNNELYIMKIFSESINDIKYDKLMFILKECIISNFEDSFINKYLDIVKKILDNLINKKISQRNRYNYSDEDSDDENPKKSKKNNFSEKFVYIILKIFYEYLIKNNIERNNDEANKEKNTVEIFKKCFEETNMDLTMRKLIEEYLNMNEYFNQKEKKQISKKETILIEIAFKYLDICLILFLRGNKPEYFEYWIKNRDKLFVFYCNYKILSTERFYDKNDYKEIFSLIAYFSDSINCFQTENSINNNKGKIFEMKFNEFNKYTSEIEKNDFITTFEIEENKENNLKVNYSKLAVFTLDKNSKEEKKYLLQDIIDINELKRKRIKYHLKLEKEIYLVPFNNIPTYLYAFGYNFNHSLGINGNLGKFYDKPTKCSGLPKYSWNISYGQNYCLALNEENNRIFACGCGKGGGFNSNPRKEFTQDTIINSGDINKDDKIIDFATGNCNASIVLNQNGEIFAIGNIENNFLKIPNLEKNKIKFSRKINLNINIKVVSMSIGYKNCFIIDNTGSLYGIGDNTRAQIYEDPDEEVNNWTKVPLPQDCRRFLQCANGERYLICLVEDDKGKGRLYARGINADNECGLKKSEDFYIPNLTQCDETQNLNFRAVYTRNNRSAAITMSGELYIWGKKCSLKNNSGTNKKNSYYYDDKEEEKEENIKCPTLVSYDKSLRNVIIDQVAISNTHIIAIGRCLENGNYVKKLFSCGNNRKGALGIKINSFSNIDNLEKLTEVKINPEDKDSKLIPIKLAVGNNRSFVLCVDENELIQQIKTNQNQSYFEIKISHFIEEDMVEKFKEFYKSENLFKFINLFRSLTYQCYSGFVDSIDKMKTKHNIPTSSIYYNEFLNYLLSQNKIHDLFMIFGLNNIESESIYNYLKTRIMIIENNIMQYCYANMRSQYKQFLQKIIGNNISYLTNELRINKFNDLLSEIRRSNGEIKTINVDRFKAKAKSFYDKYNESHKKISDFELDETIFGQVFHAMENVDSKEYFLKKDKRLFIVCLQGEHASDQGGPYHEVISNICDELQSDYIDLLIKTPNNKSGQDILSDKYILNPKSNRKIHNNAYEFLGKLMASSISTGEALDLNLHPIIWKCLLGNEINIYDYESIDYYFYKLIIFDLENILQKQDSITLDSMDLYFSIKNSNESDIELKPNGRNIKVNLSNLKEFIELSKEKRINEFKNQMEFLKKGFYSVISIDILQVLNWTQLEELVCGINKLDINDFKEHTEYEGFEPQDDNIKWFWEWFGETSEINRIKYLKFVSGRSRLPKTGLGFKYKHLISRSFGGNKNSFPKAATCFFKLNLPIYDNKEILVEKITYAIINCAEIDTDQ